MDGHNLVQEYFEFIILLKRYNTKTFKSVPIHPMLRVQSKQLTAKTEANCYTTWG